MKKKEEKRKGKEQRISNMKEAIWKKRRKEGAKEGAKDKQYERSNMEKRGKEGVKKKQYEGGSIKEAI